MGINQNETLHKPSFDHDRKVVGIPTTPYVSEAMLQKLQSVYSGLKIGSAADGSVEFTTDALAPDSVEDLVLDLTFFLQNPGIPLENLCSRLNNYEPKNESQRQLLEHALALVNLEEPSTAAGLFIYGNPGIGKTHVAIGVTKEFMRKGLEPIYGNTAQEVGGFGRRIDSHHMNNLLKPQQVWVLDDVNSPFSQGMKMLREVVINAHNFGGRVLVTSNISYDRLIRHGFVDNPDDRNRFMDRAEGMFAILQVYGESTRARKVWTQRLDLSKR